MSYLDRLQARVRLFVSGTEVLPERDAFDIKGAGATVADNATTKRSDITISGSLATNPAPVALANASATILLSSGRVRVMTSGTKSADRALTLSATGAVDGDVWIIADFDPGAFKLTIINDGVGGGTLLVFPNNSLHTAWFRFDGTNWSLYQSSFLEPVTASLNGAALATDKAIFDNEVAYLGHDAITSGSSTTLVAGRQGRVTVLSGTCSGAVVPAAASNIDKAIAIFVDGISGGTITLARSGSDVINGATSYVIPLNAGGYGSVMLYARASGVWLASPAL